MAGPSGVTLLHTYDSSDPFPTRDPAVFITLGVFLVGRNGAAVLCLACVWLRTLTNSLFSFQL